MMTFEKISKSILKPRLFELHRVVSNFTRLRMHGGRGWNHGVQNIIDRTKIATDNGSVFYGGSEMTLG